MIDIMPCSRFAQLSLMIAVGFWSNLSSHPACGQSISDAASASAYTWGNSNLGSPTAYGPTFATNSFDYPSTIRAGQTTHSVATADGRSGGNSVTLETLASSTSNLSNGETPAGANAGWQDNLWTETNGNIPSITASVYASLSVHGVHQFISLSPSYTNGNGGSSSLAGVTINGTGGNARILIGTYQLLNIGKQADGNYLYATGGSGAITWDAVNIVLTSNAQAPNSSGMNFPGNGLDSSKALASIWAETNAPVQLHWLSGAPCPNASPYGSTQSNAITPTSSSGQTLNFVNTPALNWVDPISSSSLHYATTDGSDFTAIVSFPTGIGGPFTLSSGGVTLGTFNGGDSFSFPGNGVSEFTISGIQANNPFPLNLDYSNDTASFTISPAPEPLSIALLAIGAIGLVVIARRESNK